MAPVPRCPVCASPDLRRVGDDAWRCNACDSLLATEGDAVVVRVRGEPPRPGAGRKVALAFGAVLALAGVVLLAGQLMSRSPDEVDAPVEDDFGPDIDLRDQQGGTTADGQPYWLQTYRNLDRVPIERPTIEAKLFDARGNLLGIYTGESVEPRLAPGEDTVILVVAPAEPKPAKVEVFARQPVAAAGTDEAHVPVGTRELEVAEDVVRGKVRNLGDVPARVERVAVIGRTQEGTPVAYAEGKLAGDAVLQPGDELAFEAPLGRYRVGDPTIWTGVASGVPAE